MKIELSDKFRDKFSSQIRYIAQDKPMAAKSFKNEILNEIRAIPKMPYRYR